MRAIPERRGRCVRDKALYKSTFSFTFTFSIQLFVEERLRTLLIIE